MLSIFSKKLKLKSITSGNVIKLSEVPDQVFSAGLVGEGFAVDITDGNIASPVDGEIIQVFPTGHALGIKSDSGVEILVHIGIDTVELKGEGFDIKVQKGQKVSAGDILVVADIDFIREKGKSTVTPIIFTNKNDYKSFEIKYGNHSENEEVGLVILKK